MRKFFLETNYTEKGDYLKLINSDSKNNINTGKTIKKYSTTKNISSLKEILNLNFEKDENVLSVQDKETTMRTTNQPTNQYLQQFFIIFSNIVKAIFELPRFPVL